MADIIFLSLVSSFLTMDAVVFGQFGFSRPIVCGPLIGFLVGNPLMGLHVGAILELIWINTIPIGTTLVPDVTSATIISVKWVSWLLASDFGVSLSPDGKGVREGALVAICICLALPLSLIFRKLDLIQRVRASRFNSYLEENIKQGRYSAITKVIFLSSAQHYVRNFFLFIVAFYMVVFFQPVLNLIPQRMFYGLSLGYRLLPAVGIGVFIYNFYDSVLKLVKK